MKLDIASAQWSRGRPRGVQIMSQKTVQMSLKGHSKIDVHFELLWFHFGRREDVFSSQDVPGSGWMFTGSVCFGEFFLCFSLH